MSDRLPVSVSTGRRLTVAIILVVLFVSSPTVGIVDLTPASRTPGAVGDGTANVSDVSIPAEQIRMTRGRFGTDVVYLRLPPAKVEIASVTGHPRLVYVARVPKLDFERIATTTLDPGSQGQRRIHMDARAFTYGRVGNQTYRVEVVVRVQSFEMNEEIYRRTVTVTAPARNRR